MMRLPYLGGLSLSVPEKVAYTATLLGTIGDQLSTRMGLSRSGIYESNPIAARLIANNLWLPFDILMSVALVAFTALFIRRCQTEIKWVILGFPLLLGVTRLLSTAMNLLRLFSA